MKGVSSHETQHGRWGTARAEQRKETMAVRINGPAPQGSVGRPKGRPAEKKSEGGEATAARSDSVALSSTQKAQETVRATQAPSADEAKIAELRAKIASGEYTADLRVVAERIIAETVAFSR